MPNKEKVKKVWDMLQDEYELGTPEEFEKAMEDADNREAVFGALTKKYKFSNARNLQEFDSVLGYGVQEASQSGAVDAATGVRNDSTTVGYQPQQATQSQVQNQKQATQQPLQKAPANYVEQGAQNLPTYYETATGKAKPQYGMPQDGQQAYNVTAPETNDEIEANYVKPGYVNGEGFGMADKNYGQFAYGQHMSDMKNDVERMKQGWEAQATAARQQKSLGEEVRRAYGQQRFEAANARGMAEAAGRVEAQKYGQKVVGVMAQAVDKARAEIEQEQKANIQNQKGNYGAGHYDWLTKDHFTPRANEKEIIDRVVNSMDENQLNDLINERYGKDFGDLSEGEQKEAMKMLEEYAWQALGKDYQTDSALGYIIGSMATGNLISRLNQARRSRKELEAMAQERYGKSYSQMVEEDQKVKDEVSERLYGKKMEDLEEDEMRRVSDYLANHYDLKSDALANELSSHSTAGLYQQGLSQYEAGLSGWTGAAIKGAAGFGTMVADSVPFMIAGGIGGFFGNMAKEAIVGRALAGFAGSQFERAVLVQGILKNATTQAVNSMVASGLTFGLYDAASAGVQSYAAGNFSFGDMVMAGTKGFGKGALLGGMNTALHKMGERYATAAGKAGVAKRFGVSAAGYTGEVAFFTALEQIEKNGLTFDNFDWASVGEQAVLIGLMKMKGEAGKEEIWKDPKKIIENWRKPIAKELQTDLTKDDIDTLVGLGYGKKSKSLEEWVKSLYALKVDAETGESRRADLEGALMDAQVPLEIRRKILYGYGVVTPEAMAWSVSDPVEETSEVGNKTWTVTSYTENSKPLAVKRFGNKREAEAWAENIKNGQVKNHITMMEQMAGPREKEIMNALYEMSQEGAGSLRQLIKSFNAVMNGNGTDAEKAMIDEAMKRTETKLEDIRTTIVEQARKNVGWDAMLEEALKTEPEEWTSKERRRIEEYRAELRRLDDEVSLDPRVRMMNRVSTPEGKVIQATGADGQVYYVAKGVTLKENGEIDMEATNGNAFGGAVLVYDQNGQNPRWMKPTELGQWNVAPDASALRQQIMETYDVNYGAQVGNIVSLRTRTKRADGVIEDTEKEYKVLYVAEDGTVRLEATDGSGEMDTTQGRIEHDYLTQQQYEAERIKAERMSKPYTEKDVENQQKKEGAGTAFAGEEPAAEVPAASAATEAPKPTYVPAAPMPVDENLPEGHIAEVGTKLQYHDPNTDELKNGTYAGPSTTRPGRHRIVDERGNLLRNRDGSAMEVDEMDIVLPEKAVQTTAAPVTEAPAPENVNGEGTAQVAAPAAVGAGMPLNAKGKPDPIGNGVTPERALQYFEQELMMEPEDVKNFVNGMVARAGKDMEKIIAKRPDPAKYDDPMDLQQAIAEWTAQGRALREVENRWKAIAGEIKAREEAVKAEQRAREEAIRKQMAAEEQARIDAIREQQLKETQERERAYREFQAELERKRQEQEALEAEQANEELTGDEMAEQAVMEEQKRRERMRIGQRLAEVGQLTDLDQPADEAMAAQVAYLSPDFKVTPESLRLELGSNFGKFGREGMLRLADNNGRTISEIADSIAQAAGYDANGQWRLDANTVREELIKCIREGSAEAITALEKRVGIGTQRPEDRPEYWTEEKIAEYEAKQQQNQQMTEVQQQIAAASEEVNTSPTDAQKEAGNYKKGHVKLDGMEISIEQPKGSQRSGVDADGLPWSVRMNNTYGYIRGTKGKDKDHIDIYLSDNPEEGSVFVVDQIDPRTGEFDEHKVMYGFNSLEEAREAYLSNYMSDWKGLGNITEVNKTAFKVWLSESVHKTKPFADYRLVKAEQAKMGLERGYEAGRDPFAQDRTGEFLNGNEGLETIEGEAPFRSILKPIDIPADMPEHMVKAGNDAVEMGKKLHTKVNVCWDMSQIPEDARAYKALKEGKQVGGWYSAKDGEVYLYMPHLENPEEVMKTLLHETVAHRGMREMFGEDFETMLDNVYKYASEDLKKSIDAYWKEMGFTSQRQAVDEYIAKIAEEGPQSYQDKTLLSKVKGFIINALRKMGFDMGDYRLTDDDIRYMLAKSHDYMQYEKTDMKSEYKPKGQIEKLGGEKEFVEDPFASKFDTLKPVGTNRFGEIYNWTLNKVNEALDFLSSRKSGYLKGVFHRDDIGDIDLVWGEAPNDYNGHGLAHIDRKHVKFMGDFTSMEDAMEKITDVINNGGELKQTKDPEIAHIEKGDYRVVIAKNKEGNWVLSAFDYIHSKKEKLEKKNAAAIGTASQPTEVDEARAVTSNPSVSERKVTNFSANGQGKNEISDLDTPFSVRKDKEEKKSLAGMHNIGVNQLEKALKQGGLANPSAAVIDVDKQSHDKYGAVTLLMPKDLVAAKSGRHSGAYGGDIYSPNYPHVTTQMDRSDESRMDKWLIDSDNQGENKMASYMSYRIKESLNNGDVDGLEYLYLKEKGVDMSQIDEYEHHDADYLWKKIVKDYDHWYKLVDAMKNDETLKGTVNTTILNKHRADFVKDIKPHEGETMQDRKKRKYEWWNEVKKELLEDNGNVSEYLIEDYFNEQWKAYHTNGRFEDRYTAGNASQYVNEHNLRSDYERWANEQLQQFNPKEKLYNGTDRNGRAKYVDNTLENASKIMKKQGLRAGDSFFASGMGGARAQLTPVFKTLKEIKANKGRLDSEAFNKQKKELEDEYYQLGKLFRDGEFDYSDQNYYRLIEAMKSGDAARWAGRNGYKLSEEDAKRIDDFGTALRLMPTDYFEIKFERPVGIEEFAAAIVPDNMDANTIKALQDKGLEVRTYKDGDEADRANVMRGMVSDREDILFNRTWHGSSANFDEFDHSFMGTGEGSRVYGWGTYVSEVDGIAKSYADIATTKRQKSTTPLVRWKGRAEVDFSNVNPLRMAYDVVDTSRTIAEARQRAERYAEMAEEPEMKQKWQAALDILKQSTKADFKPEPVKGNRHLYEVEIPEDNGKNYLSWNDAVSADMLGRIKEEAVKEGYEAVADMVDYYTRNDEISGGDLYNKIIANGLFLHEKVKQADAHKVASKLLNNAGIVGVKVPTNNLRSGDKSKNNYVIFDEKNAQIVDHTRYNQENGENGYQKMTVAESDELTARLKDVLGKNNVFAMDQEHFDKALDKVAGHGTAEMIRDEGGTVYGFAIADKIYYNTDKMNAHTPVHEHGHIWTKVVKEKNPELYQRGMNLWKGAGLWDKVKADMQSRGEAATDDAVLSEVVSLFTGQTNEKAVAEITGNSNKSFVARCKQWLEDWWQTIKDYVGKSAFSKWSQEELDRLTKEEFASMPLKALYDDAEAKAMRKAMGEGDQTRSDNFKKWFGDWENDPENASKVVDENGKPLVVYHGTKGTFNTFAYNPEDIGFHFGNKTTARTRVGRGKDARLMPVYLDINNPLVIDTDLGAWDADYLAEYLSKNNLADKDAIAKVILNDAAIEKFGTDVFDASNIQQIAPRYRRSSANSNAKMRELLKGLGYDGIEYSNYYESNGSKSWIALDKSQIKSAVDNNGDFSRENKDIRYNRVDPENPNDDPTTPGGGGSSSPTGGRERSLEEMIDYDAQEFKREFERMKTENDQITLGARVREFIRNRMTPLAGKRMTASDINGLMRDVDYAITHKSKKGLERALNRMQTLIHQAEGLAQIEEMMKTLNTRTTTVDKKGMVKGVLVDEAANEVLNNIKSSYKQMLSTSYDERLSEVRREMRALKEQYGITRQDDPTAPEEFKTRMQELKEKQEALKAERDGVLSSQVEETIESLNTLEEDINNQIGNLAVNEDGDAVTPNATKLERLTQEKLTIEIRKKLAELRQMMSAKQEIQKELDRTGSPKERQRLEEEIDKMQKRINITSRGITEELKDIISEGRSRRAEFVKADMERQMRIVRMGCNAVRDKEVPDTLDKKNSRTNWQSVQGWFADKRDMLQAPIFSFNFMAKYIDHNNAQGDGEFYNYFMRGENGALKANNEYSKGTREFGEAVDNKCKEIFGKGIDKVKKEAAKLTDKKITKLVPDKSIPEEEWSEKHVRMTKGQMLYAWLTWRQEAGRTKMEADGWTKRSIEEMQEQLGPEMLELGRWMTDDFLKALRDDKYNVTYEKVMGTSMHKAAHYFPLRIDKLSVQEKSEIGQDGTINLLPSSSSGNLIVRTTNRLPVDLSNDAFDVLEDYGRTMERWNAMAELTKDLNTLIKSQGFRNLMEANHEGLFKRWKDACAVATASYHTEATDTDKALSTLHNGFMQQAIGYGYYTAIKQTLSAPAFWLYSWDPRYWGKEIWYGNVFRSWHNYKWAKEHLPSFAERIAANDFGIEAINDKSVVDKLTRLYKKGGMAANKLVDAITVANGARAVYEYDKGRFMKMTNEDGSRKYTDEQAEELAKVNAQIVFNESQQSSRNEFSAPIQKQRGIVQRSMVAFQNSNIGYRRMMVEGLEDIFSKNGNRSRGFAKVLTVGILNAAWYMGLNPALAYNKLTGRTDDEEDEKFWDGILSSVVLGYLSNGTILGPAMTAWTSEFGSYNPIQVFDLIDQKMDEAKKQYKKDDMGAMSWAVIDNILKFGGVNLEKWDGMYSAFYNAIKRGEWKADDTLSFLNMARTQRRELANHDLEDKTATEYMVDVMRADKKIEEGDRGRGWWNGDAYNKVLTNDKRKEIINDYVKKSVPDFEPLKKKLDDAKTLVNAKVKEIKASMPKAKPGKGEEKDLLALNQAIDEVLKDDPEMLKVYKRYVNSSAGRVEKKGKWVNETYAEKHKRLAEKLANAVKAMDDGSGTYNAVDIAAMELIWMESDLLDAINKK